MRRVRCHLGTKPRPSRRITDPPHQRRGRHYGQVTETGPLARVQMILDGKAAPSSWPEIQDLAHELAPTDRATAAQLLAVASGLAESIGQTRQAVGLARSAVYIASHFNAPIAAQAGDAALASLEQLTSAEEYFDEANELAQAFTATGLTAHGVNLARAAAARAKQLPPSPAARVAQAQALSCLAAAHLRADQFHLALDALVEARAVVPSDAHKVIGDIEFNEGLARASLDQIGPAREAYRLSRSAFELGGDEVDLAYLDRSEGAALALPDATAMPWCSTSGL